jgi:hypothetical protein
MNLRDRKLSVAETKTTVDQAVEVLRDSKLYTVSSTDFTTCRDDSKDDRAQEPLAVSSRRSAYACSTPERVLTETIWIFASNFLMRGLLDERLT